MSVSQQFCILKIYRTFCLNLQFVYSKITLFMFRILIFCLSCSRAAVDYFFDYIGNAVPVGIVPHAHKVQR